MIVRKTKLELELLQENKYLCEQNTWCLAVPGICRTIHNGIVAQQPMTPPNLQYWIQHSWEHSIIQQMAPSLPYHIPFTFLYSQALRKLALTVPLLTSIQEVLHWSPVSYQLAYPRYFVVFPLLTQTKVETVHWIQLQLSPSTSLINHYSLLPNYLTYDLRYWVPTLRKTFCINTVLMHILI
jgi:hypothetical protein